MIEMHKNIISKTRSEWNFFAKFFTKKFEEKGCMYQNSSENCNSYYNRSPEN